MRHTHTHTFRGFLQIMSKWETLPAIAINCCIRYVFTLCTRRAKRQSSTDGEKTRLRRLGLSTETEDSTCEQDCKSNEGPKKVWPKAMGERSTRFMPDVDVAKFECDMLFGEKDSPRRVQSRAKRNISKQARLFADSANLQYAKSETNSEETKPRHAKPNTRIQLPHQARNFSRIEELE